MSRAKFSIEDCEEVSEATVVVLCFIENRFKSEIASCRLLIYCYIVFEILYFVFVSYISM